MPVFSSELPSVAVPGLEETVCGLAVVGLAMAVCGLAVVGLAMAVDGLTLPSVPTFSSSSPALKVCPYQIKVKIS